MRPRLLILASLGWLLVEPARAQRAADIAAGRQLATRHCSRCHGIDDERFQLTPGALPLRELKLLDAADDLARLLATEMATIHPLLPGVALSLAQRATLQAYLDSLSIPGWRGCGDRPGHAKPQAWRSRSAPASPVPPSKR